MTLDAALAKLDDALAGLNAGSKQHKLLTGLQELYDGLDEAAGGKKGVGAARTLLKETISKLKGMKLDDV